MGESVNYLDLKATDPITLPEGGKNWRWLAGTVPPVCTQCGDEPSVAQYANFPVCWFCLRVVVATQKRASEYQGEDE